MLETDWERSDLEPLDGAIVAGIAATILFAAVSLGAVQAWSEQVVMVACTAIAALATVRVWRDRGGSSPPWGVIAPIGLFLALVSLQLLALPSGAVDAASPQTMRLRRELLTDLPGLESLLASSSISLYSEPGWKNLRMLLSVTAVFVASVSIARRRPARRALLGSLAAIGAAVACVALAHQAMGVPAVWGRFNVPLPPTRAAPFINHSHFAQFMNLSLGFALAVALPAAVEFRRHRHPRGPGDWWNGLREGQLIRLPLALAAGLLITLALALCGSRGGLISLAVAGLLTAVVSSFFGARGHGSRATAPLLLLVLATVVLLAYAASDHVGRRVEQLAEASSGGERLTILSSLIPAWKAFPMLGTGLGTFEFVFPMYDKTSAINLYTHAENEYAQLLTETGVIGLGLALWFIVAVWIAYARCIRRGGRVAQVAIGLGFGFAAILVHSSSDFGQHIPAPALATAVVTGLLVGLGGRSHPTPGEPGQSPGRTWTVALPAGACAAMLLLLPQADTARRAEAAYLLGKRLSDGLAYQSWDGTDDEFRAALGPMTAAVNLRPGNVVYRYDLNVLRFYSLARNPEGILPVDDPATTAPTGDAPGGGAMAKETIVEYVRRILGELNAARLTCPTYGPAHSMAGHILRKLGHEQHGLALLTRAATLTSYDGVTLLFNAESAMRSGDVETAKRQFARSAQLLATDMGQVIRRFILEYQLPADGLELAGDRADWLRVAMEALRSSGEPELASEARRRYTAALRLAADAPGAGAGTMHQLAQLLIEDGNHAEAITFLQRAVFRQPDRADWQLQLAGQLAEAGEIESALESARAAARYRPGWSEATRMIADLEARAATRPAR